MSVGTVRYTVSESGERIYYTVQTTDGALRTMVESLGIDDRGLGTRRLDHIIRAFAEAIVQLHTRLSEIEDAHREGK